jgi:hypothetical protein
MHYALIGGTSMVRTPKQRYSNAVLIMHRIERRVSRNPYLFYICYGAIRNYVHDEPGYGFMPLVVA